MSLIRLNDPAPHASLLSDEFIPICVRRSDAASIDGHAAAIEAGTARVPLVSDDGVQHVVVTLAET